MLALRVEMVSRVLPLMAIAALFGQLGGYPKALGMASVLLTVMSVVPGLPMLPFLLRRVGLDPASASAPFVATLVDVTGIVIYFSIASIILRGALL